MGLSSGMRRLTVLLCVLLGAASTAWAAGQRVVYVNAVAPAGGSGLSWATAFRSLNQALAAASSLQKPVQVWVAGGVYTPFDGSTSRTLSFKLESGVEVYGGFGGTETLLSQRMPGEFITILSGDRLGNDTLGTFLNYSENSYHVVTAPTVDASAILDGFFVQSGNANQSPGANATGAGVYITGGGGPTLRDVTVRYNTAIGNGGGIAVVSSQPTISDCSVYNNRATNNGGGLAISSGSIVTIDSTIFDTNACGVDVAGRGGAIYLSTGSELRISNSSFTNNTASSDGGAIGESGAIFLTVVSSYFASNSVPTVNPSPIYSGGAIAALGPNTIVDVSRSRFQSNTVTAGWGGAIGVSTLPLRVVACEFYTNRASAIGGGIYANSASVAATDSIFAGNGGTSGAAASGNGGAVGVVNSTLNVSTCTITGNASATASGYAVSVASGGLTMSNSIVFGNTGLGQIFTGAGVTSSIQFSCVQGNLQPGTGNINTNPQFRVGVGGDGQWGTLDDDLRLNFATSPCIDTGSNALLPADVLDIDVDANFAETLPQDVKGSARVVRDRAATASAIVNMGAIEGGLDQYIWRNGNGGSWSSTSSWSSDAVPTQSVVAVFNNTITPLTSGYTVQMVAGTRAPEAYQVLFNTNRAVAFNFNLDNLTLVGGKPGDESLEMPGLFGNSTGQLILQSNSTLFRRGIVANSAAVATSAGVPARLIHTGAFAGLDLADQLVVGASGNGVMDIQNGATANVGSFISGQFGSGSGTTALTGSATLNINAVANSRVLLGDEGSGILSFNSSKLTAVGSLQSITLGNQSQSLGQILLDSSTWKTSQSTMTVGSLGSAALQLTNGSKLTTTTAASPSIARFPGSSASVLIDGTSSWIENGPGAGIAIGGASGSQGGIGLVDVRAGGVLKANGPIVLYDRGTARGLGQFIAPVNNWGDFSPGILGANPFGILNVTGTFTQTSFGFFNIGTDPSPFGPRSNADQSGVYTCDVQGTGPGVTHDQINVVGTAVLGGGIIVRDNDYSPPPQNGPTGVKVLLASLLDRQFDVALMPPILGKRFLSLSYGLSATGPAAPDIADSAAPSALVGASVELVTDAIDSEIQFVTGANRAAAGNPNAIATGDVNGDSRPDLVACFSNANPAIAGTVVVYINNGTFGTTWLGYTARPAITVGVNPRGVAIAKLRTGFNRDIIVTNAGDGTIDVLTNNNASSPTFTRNTIATQPVGSEPWDVAVFGRDPISGLDSNFAVANRGANSVSSFTNTGSVSTIFKAAELPSGPNPVDVEPFDPDSGKDDDQASIAVSSGGGTDVTVFVNNGTGTLSSGTAFTVGGTPGKITHGDFDGDFADDIAVVSPTSGLLMILLGDGLGGFKPAVDLPVGVAPTDVKALDADNDGDIDLIVVDDLGATSTTQVYRNDLTYSVSGTPIQLAICPEDVLTAAATAGLAAIADVDASGFRDVITVDSTSASPRIASAINRSTPCRCDFNGDGFLDFSDFDSFVIAFEVGSLNADFNGDSFLDFSDFDDFVAAFEAGC